MNDYDERQVGDLIIRIDRTLCVGFGDCVDEKDAAFSLDIDGVAVFHHPECTSREAIICACEACPVDALSYTPVQEKDCRFDE